MNTTTKAAQTVAELQADYGLRGRDFDTALIGPVTESIIDADRLVRAEWRNGFPNWAMYRAVLAGDSLYLPELRRWVVAFAVTCGRERVRRSAYSDEFACVAGWDALHMLLHQRQLQPYTATADTLGVDHKTYKRLRDCLYLRLRASLDEYWIQLGAAYRHVLIYERKSGSWKRDTSLEGWAE